MECYSVLFLVLCFISAAISLNSKQFRWNKNSESDDVTMTENVIESIDDVTVVSQCIMHCVNKEKCLSVSYNSEERTCKLYSVKRIEIHKSVTSTGSHHYSIGLGDCPTRDGFFLLRDVALCLKMSTTLQQRKQAREDCTKIGSRLIVVDTEEKNSAVTNYLRSIVDDISDTGNTEIAIGLTDEKNEGVFVWENGNNLTFSNWHYGEPNNRYGMEDCVLLVSKYGQWTDCRCTKSLKYICEIPV